jgi:hypothetical protein
LDPSSPPARSELVLPIEADELIKVPHHAHCSGNDTLRLLVKSAGPAFRWTGGDLWQELYALDVDRSGVPRGTWRRVVTVRVREAKCLDGSARRLPSPREGSSDR